MMAKTMKSRTSWESEVDMMAVGKPAQPCCKERWKGKRGNYV